MSLAHDLLIKIAADPSGLVAGLGKADGALSKFESGVSKVRGALGGLATGLGGLGLVSVVKSSVDAADALKDMSTRTGASVEDLSAMRLIADKSGTSLEGVGKALRSLSKNQYAANEGNKEMAALFEKMGISGDSSLEALIAVSDQIKAIPSDMERLAVAEKLFGKAGMEMLPVLTQGSAALKEQVEWAKKHANITQEDADRADNFNDKLSEMSAVVGSITTKTLSGPLDTLLVGLNAVLAWTTEHPELASWLAMGALGAVAVGVGAGAAAMAIGGIGSAIGALIPLMTGLATLVMAHPVLALIVGAVAIGMAVHKNWDSISAAAKKGVADVRATISSWYKVGEDIINGLWEGIKATLRKPIDAINGLAKDLPEWARKALGIKSPSTVFAKIGQNIGAGLVQGIEGSVPDVANASDKLIEAVIVEPSQMARTAGGKFKSSADAARQGTGALGGISEYVDSIKSANDNIKDMTVKVFSGMEDALTKFVTTGKISFKSLANSIIADMVRMVIQQNITKPLAIAGSALFSSFLPSAKGNVFSGPGISAYSNSVVSRPTVFPFASGAGLMGEAGPEAIMPLTRTAGGKLGVSAETGSTTVNVNFSVNAIDTQSAMGVIMQNKSAIIGMVQGAFNKAGRYAPMIA